MYVIEIAGSKFLDTQFYTALAHSYPLLIWCFLAGNLVNGLLVAANFELYTETRFSGKPIKIGPDYLFTFRKQVRIIK
jgi:hypothetical protein